MAAASSKPTAVHFSLVFFVMATLILAIVCYWIGKEYTVANAAAAKAKDDLSERSRTLERATGEIRMLKEAIGINLDDIGTNEQPAENTVLGSLTRILLETGRDQARPTAQKPTVVETLRSLRDALNSETTYVQQRQAELVKIQAELDQERATHVSRADELQASQTDSEAQLQKQLSERNELLNGKDTEIARWRDQFRREQIERERLSDEYTKFRRDREEEFLQLENRISFMRQQLNDLENLSFDKPDGEIVRVDNTTRTVWINLGSDQNLRNQVPFSVYTRSHRGVGRGRDDIKAKIEVTKIREGNLAEARIISEDLHRPIQAGDPIYSPAWSAGAKEHFSFVGLLDVTGDGVSDRELIHNLLANAGAGVELEVSDEGLRSPDDTQLTVKSKFLVVGLIEDPTNYPAADTVKQQQIQATISEHRALVRDAQRQGIRVVSLADFLNYMGYQPQQRLFVPGEGRARVLKHGSRSTGVDEVYGASRLQNSGATTGRFKSQPRSSSGR